VGCRPVLGPTKPPMLSVPGAPSSGVKQQGRVADCSPPTSAEVKNTWIYTSTPLYIFMAWCLIKCREIFTFNIRHQIGLCKYENRGCSWYNVYFSRIFTFVITFICKHHFISSGNMEHATTCLFCSHQVRN
jgi:hypothetical protein